MQAPQKTTQRQQDLSRMPKQLKSHAFAPGKSGNPGGMPKHGRIDKTIRDFMGDKEKHALVKAMYTSALRGNVQAASWICEHGWGKLPDRIEGEFDSRISVELIKSIVLHAGLNQ